MFWEKMRRANLKCFSQDRKLIGLAGNQVRLFKVITKINFSSSSISISSEGRILTPPEAHSELCAAIPERRSLITFNLGIKCRMEKS